MIDGGDADHAVELAVGEWHATEITPVRTSTRSATRAMRALASKGSAVCVYRVPDLGGIGEVALAFSGLVGGRRALAGPIAAHAGTAAPPSDLALRMGSAAGAVVLFTALADVIGPRLSGVLSVFPIVTLILAIFTHLQRGPDSMAVFLPGLLSGLYGLALFCLVFSVTIGRLRWSLLLAVSVALATQVAVQATMLRRMSRPLARHAP